MYCVPIFGMIDSVIKSPVMEETIEEPVPGGETEGSELAMPRESVLNTVRVTLVGRVSLDADQKPCFSRSIFQVPEIDWRVQRIEGCTIAGVHEFAIGRKQRLTILWRWDITQWTKRP